MQFSEKIIYKILKKYGYEDFKIFESQSGYRNFCLPFEVKNGEKLNLIIYKAERNILDKIKAANLVSSFLRKKGFQVRAAVKPTMKVSAQKNLYACIYNYLDGATIPWEAYSMKHLKLMGKTLSDLHFALSDFDDFEMLPHIIEVLKIQNNSMRKYFADEHVIMAIRNKLGLKFKSFEGIFAYVEGLASETEDCGVLHMDFVRGNLLFGEEVDFGSSGAPASKLSIHDNQLSRRRRAKPCQLKIKKNEIKKAKTTLKGIIDFEKTCKGPICFEIARTLAFLFIDCKYKDPKEIVKYFLYSGYLKKGQNKKIEKLKQLKPLISYFLLYDFYKFLKHNPYESLGQNQHFIRTKAILLSQQKN